MTFGNVIIISNVTPIPGAPIGEVNAYWNSFIQRAPGDEVSNGVPINGGELTLRTWPSYNEATGNYAVWGNAGNMVTDTDRTLYLPTSILGTGTTGGNPQINFVSPTSGYTAERWTELYGLDWTIEMWVYFDSIANDIPFLASWNPAADASKVIRLWWDQVDSEMTLDLNIKGTGVVLDAKVWSWLPSINTWYHLAVVRNGANIDFYVNGTKQGTSYNIGASTLLNAISYQGSGPSSEGAQWSVVYANLSDAGRGNLTIPGTLDDFRVTRSALYTANFDAPGEAFPLGDPPISDPIAAPQPTFGTVIFQANFDGADGATAHTTQDDYARTCTFTANAELDTAQFKFGTASLYTVTQSAFPASGVAVPRLANDTFDQEDFTIECWTRLASLPSADATHNVGYTAMSKWANSGNDRQWLFGFTQYDGLTFSFGYQLNGEVGSYFDANTIECPLPNGITLSTDTWYHIAASRENETLRLFFDGYIAYEDNSFFIDAGSGGSGRQLDGGFGNFAILGTEDAIAVNRFRNLNGWVDDARIIKGQAIYTQRFTPPDAAHPPPERYNSEWIEPDEWVLEQEWNDDGGVGVSDLSSILDTYTSRQIGGLSWNPDGTRCIITNTNDDNIKSFSCSTPYDPTTASQVGTSRGGPANPANPHWGPDGTFYFVDSSSDGRHRIDSSTYTVGSGDTQTSFVSEVEATGSNNTQDGAFCVSPDGDYVMTINDSALNPVIANRQALCILPMTTPFDLDSVNTAARSVGNVEPPFGGSSFFSNSIQVSQDGTTLYYLNSNTLYKLTMSTPWDATTVTVNTGTSLYFGNSPGNDWMWMNDKATELWVGSRFTNGGVQTRIQKYVRP